MSRDRETGGVRKRGRIWWLYYTVDGKRYDESTRQGDELVARSILAQRRREIREGTWDPPNGPMSLHSTRARVVSLERELAREYGKLRRLIPRDSLEDGAFLLHGRVVTPGELAALCGVPQPFVLDWVRKTGISPHAEVDLRALLSDFESFFRDTRMFMEAEK